MGLFTSEQFAIARDISELGLRNPFSAQRIEFERRVLGDQFLETGADWNAHIESLGGHPNMTNVYRCSERLVAKAHEELCKGTAAPPPAVARQTAPLAFAFPASP